MSERYPGYDVMAKRHSPSWNDQTREVVEARVALDPDHHTFFDDHEFATLRALCDRITPQQRDPPGPVAALVDQKLAADARDGYRHASMPPLREAWRRGLSALDHEARHRYGRGFAQLHADAQDELLRHVEKGETESASWDGVPARLFFKAHVLTDIVSAYYALPCAWNEIGFGGPASPRGYVRLTYNRIDPWEAAEAKPGHEEEARRHNGRIR